jgi:hypothetical protein
MRTIEEIEKEIRDRVQEKITKEIWEWDNVTRRRSGKTVSSPRDIVDRAKLLNELNKFTIDRKNNRIQIRLLEYANIVHFGSKNMKGRPYVSDVLDEMGLDYDIL